MSEAVLINLRNTSREPRTRPPASRLAAWAAAALDLPNPAATAFFCLVAMVGFGKALAAQLEDQPEWREVGEQGFWGRAACSPTAALNATSRMQLLGCDA